MDAHKPNPLFLRFEAHTGLGPTQAARLLGIPYITYAQRRSGMRPVKTEHVFHMEVVMLLRKSVLKDRIKEVVHGNQE
jgi:hypothetical protein